MDFEEDVQHPVCTYVDIGLDGLRNCPIDFQPVG
jgi:hypothetical protein